MTGPKLRVVRVENTIHGLLGVLVVNGTAFCWTLQPDPTDKHFSILAGEYPYRRFHGTKHKDTFEIVVPGHTALLFHGGNFEDDSEGCVLVGADKAFNADKQRCVVKSIATFEAFMSLMGQATEGIVTFIDAF